MKSLFFSNLKMKLVAKSVYTLNNEENKSMIRLNTPCNLNVN